VEKKARIQLLLMREHVRSHKVSAPDTCMCLLMSTMQLIGHSNARRELTLCLRAQASHHPKAESIRDVDDSEQGEQISFALIYIYICFSLRTMCSIEH
jgi:hypothetical protein